MNHDSGEIKKFIGGWLRVVSNAVAQSFARELKGSGVTPSEFVILRIMHHSGATLFPSELTRRTGLTRGAVSRLVDRATRKKLIVRTESKQDRRYQELRLTKRASQLIPELEKMGQKTDDLFFSCLTSAERKTLVRLLRKVAHSNDISEMPTK